MQTDVRRGWALATVAALLLAACAAPRNLSSVSPQASSSPTEDASPSPSPSPTAALAISSFALHAGEVGLSYSAVTLGATGGLPPYSWSLAGGSLPPGLALSAGGVLSGSNSSPGTFSFTVQVADSSGGAVTQNGSIAVYSALTMTQPCVGQCVIGKGCTKCGVFGTVSRGLAPYTYRIVGGAVPPGMTWTQLSLVGGFPAGGYSLSVQVTDKLGAKVTVAANWSVYNPVSFLRGRASTDCINSANPPHCSTTGWSYSGGNPSVPPTAAIVGYSQYCEPTFGQCFPVPTAPPPQWNVAIAGGNITFSAGGIACNASPYGGKLTIELRDPSKCATTSASNRLVLIVYISNNC
jgi:hypothetical protein